MLGRPGRPRKLVPHKGTNPLLSNMRKRVQFSLNTFEEKLLEPLSHYYAPMSDRDIMHMAVLLGLRTLLDQYANQKRIEELTKENIQKAVEEALEKREK